MSICPPSFTCPVIQSPKCSKPIQNGGMKINPGKVSLSLPLIATFCLDLPI